MLRPGNTWLGFSAAADRTPSTNTRTARDDTMTERSFIESILADRSCRSRPAQISGSAGGQQAADRLETRAIRSIAAVDPGRDLDRATGKNPIDLGQIWTI